MEMTRTEALTLALKLAVQAPTQAQSDEALAHAHDIAVGMDDHDIGLCKKAAEAACLYPNNARRDGMRLREIITAAISIIAVFVGGYAAVVIGHGFGL